MALRRCTALPLLLAALPPAHFIVRERQRPGDGQGRAAEVVCRGGRRGAVFLRATEKLDGWHLKRLRA